MDLVSLTIFVTADVAIFVVTHQELLYLALALLGALFGAVDE